MSICVNNSVIINIMLLSQDDLKMYQWLLNSWKLPYLSKFDIFRIRQGYWTSDPNLFLLCWFEIEWNFRRNILKSLFYCFKLSCDFCEWVQSEIVFWEQHQLCIRLLEIFINSLGETVGRAWAQRYQYVILDIGQHSNQIEIPNVRNRNCNFWPSNCIKPQSAHISLPIIYIYLLVWL